MPVAKPFPQELIRHPSGVPGLAEPGTRLFPKVAGTLLLMHANLVALLWAARQLWPGLENFFSNGSLQSYVVNGILMQGALIFLPTVLIILFYRLPTASVMGVRARSGSMVLGFTVGIPAAVVFQGLNNLLVYVLIQSKVSLPNPSGQASPVGRDFLQQPLPLIVLVILVGVIMPGLIEELMFRGVILASLASTGAAASAIFWQALAFALFHADPLFILPPFLAGLLLASIRRNSDSLWPAMMAHMSLNLTLLAITPLLPRLTTQYLAGAASKANSLLYASLIAACIAAVALVPLLILINHRQTRDERASRRLHFFPADWKYALAILVLLATMMLENR
jgi:membrane protease YdiL (CAAX protease family)